MTLPAPTEPRPSARGTATVRSVECFGMRAPLPGGGYGTAKTLVDARIGTAVKVTTSDGVVGWGESFGPPSLVFPVVQAYAEQLVGRPLHRREEFLLTPVNEAYHLASSGLVVAALSGLDIATWDAWARTLGVPVSHLLGGQVRDTVPAYASSGYVTPDRDLGRLRAEFDRHVADGFDRVKLKIGISPREDAARAQAARDAFGPAGAVMLDYNANETAASFLASYAAVRDIDPLWIEEPLPRHDTAGWAQLAQVPTPLAAGEALYTRFEFRDAIAEHRFDVVQPDVAKCGGFTEAAAVRTMTVAANLRFSPHCWGSGIALAACLQLLASTVRLPSGTSGPGDPLLELDQGLNPLREGVLTEPIRAENGLVPVPAGPGLGVTINEDWIRHHATHHALLA